MGFVVSSTITKQKTSKNKGMLYHNLRASSKVENVRDDTKNNKVFVFENDEIKSVEFNTKDKIKNNKLLNYISNKIDNVEEQIQDDYKKNHGKSLPRNSNNMLDGIITFGVDDVDKDSRTLTQEENDELNKINLEEMDRSARNYLKDLEKEYGIKVNYMVRHQDEKTIHYHFSATSYDFKNHKSMTSNFKKRDMSKMGEKIQDLVAKSYENLGFKRGKSKSKAKHQTILEMHKNELLDLSSQIDTTKIDLEKLLENLDDVKTNIDFNKIKMDKLDFAYNEAQKRTFNEKGLIGELEAKKEAISTQIQALSLKLYRDFENYENKIKNHILKTNENAEKTLKSLEEIHKEDFKKYDEVQKFVKFIKINNLEDRYENFKIASKHDEEYKKLQELQDLEETHNHNRHR